MKVRDVIRFRKESEKILEPIEGYSPVIQVWEEVSANKAPSAPPKKRKAKSSSYSTTTKKS